MEARTKSGKNQSQRGKMEKIVSKWRSPASASNGLHEPNQPILRVGVAVSTMEAPRSA